MTCAIPISSLSLLQKNKRGCPGCRADCFESCHSEGKSYVYCLQSCAKEKIPETSTTLGSASKAPKSDKKEKEAGSKEKKL